MIYTELTKKAVKICWKVHRDQVDKGDLPYVFHPWHLAEEMDDEVSVCTALLHDVLEDSRMTEDDLRKEGFPEEVITALSLLTRKGDIPYMVYVQNIADRGGTAAKVKMADLRHNLQEGRLESLTDRDRLRIEKYRVSLRLLEDSAKK